MKTTSLKIIAVDFDDTVVKQRTDSRYPEVGPTIDQAVVVLKKLSAVGHRLILWTVRDMEQSGILKAIQWYHDNDIPLYGINSRPQYEVAEDSKAMRNSASPKVRANLYIDDAALGCPLIHEEGWRPYVDWQAVEMHLVAKGYLHA